MFELKPNVQEINVGADPVVPQGEREIGVATARSGTRAGRSKDWPLHNLARKTGQVWKSIWVRRGQVGLGRGCASVGAGAWVEGGGDAGRHDVRRWGR